MDLQQMIRARGLKQKWIAGQLGISQPFFSEIVRGIKAMPIDKVIPLSEILRVSAEDVLRAATTPPRSDTAA